MQSSQYLSLVSKYLLSTLLNPQTSHLHISFSWCLHHHILLLFCLQLINPHWQLQSGALELRCSGQARYGIRGVSLAAKTANLSPARVPPRVFFSGRSTNDLVDTFGCPTIYCASLSRQSHGCITTQFLRQILATRVRLKEKKWEDREERARAFHLPTRGAFATVIGRIISPLHVAGLQSAAAACPFGVVASFFWVPGWGTNGPRLQVLFTITRFSRVGLVGGGVFILLFNSPYPLTR